MEYILNNTILALLDYPGSTLLGINRLLAEKKYRAKVIAKLKDPVVKGFWQNEFASYNDRYAQEAVAPIQNKIGQFLSAAVIRNMVAQVKSTINVREIMDGQKIFIMNLSKGRIGEDNSRLLGGMLITQLQLAAMERVDTPEKDRKDFFLYVDEFQNFATPSFANILSEARKYRLSLIMAHQYVKQLDEVVADAVFGNVGTIVTFRVGGGDAEALAKEFTPTFLEEDIVNLAKYQIFLKLMIDGVASQPFSAMTMPPIGSPTGSSEKVIRVSRERYAKKREEIEEKIMRWSGMEMGGGEDDDENSEPIGSTTGNPGAPTPKPVVATPTPHRDILPAPKPAMSTPSVHSGASFSLKDLPTRDGGVHAPKPVGSFGSQGNGQTQGDGKKRKRKRKKKNPDQSGQPQSQMQTPRPSVASPAVTVPAPAVIQQPKAIVPLETLQQKNVEPQIAVASLVEPKPDIKPAAPQQIAPGQIISFYDEDDKKNT